MATSVRWKVTSRLDEIARTGIPRAVERKLEKATRRGEAHAKSRTPVDTGAAKASIDSSVDGTTATLSLDTRSGYFSEIGSRGRKGTFMLRGGGGVIASEMAKGKLDVR